jgi:hypothetical protein
MMDCLDSPLSTESTALRTSSSTGITNHSLFPEHDIALYGDGQCSNPSPLSYDFHLHAVIVDENPYKIFVYMQPTAGDGKASCMSLSKVFILNDEPCFRWRIIGMACSKADGRYFVCTAQGVGFDRSITVVVPCEWGYAAGVAVAEAGT